MIKRFNKILAGITAAAALLLAAGCKNQLDYLNDTIPLNKMYIEGFKVSGLDAAYNQATAALYIANKADPETTDFVKAGEAVVAAYTKTTDAEGNVTYSGTESGSAYVKFSEPYLFDGDSIQTSKVKMYLQVGTDEFKIADLENSVYKPAELSVKTSPANTADNELKKAYVKVSVYDGTYSYEWASSAQADLTTPVYMCDFDISSAKSASDSSIPEGITLTTSAKKGTNNKYTVTFKGLTDNIGTKFVVAGAAISSKDSGLGDNWNIMETAGIKVSAVVTDEGLVKEVDEKGEITFEFYGSKPSWASNKSPAIKIAAYNVDQDPWVCLLSNAGGNWFFPDFTDGFDTTMEVDLAKLSKSGWRKSDAYYEVSSFRIDGIKIINAPKANAYGKVFIVDGDDTTDLQKKDRILFVPGNTWGYTAHSYTDAEINSNGNFGWVFDEPVEFKPNRLYFNISARLVNPKNDSNFWDSGDKKGSYSVYYKTTDWQDKNATLIIDCTDPDNYVEYLVPTSIVDYEFEVTLNKLIVNAALDGVELIGAFNNWQDTNTIKGTADSSAKTTTFDISTIAAKDLGSFKIRSIGTWDSYNIGDETNTSKNIELPTASKNGKVNLKVTYTSGNSIDAISLEYVN